MMKTTLKLFGLMAITAALMGCETVFRVVEYAFLPAELLIRPMNRLIVKQCPGSTNPWDGTAGSPCQAAIAPQKYSVEVGRLNWGPSITSTCAPDIFPAATYADNCASCHETGKAPDLRYSAMVGRATSGELGHFIQNGNPIQGMPSFAGRLTQCQIDGVAKYIIETRAPLKSTATKENAEFTECTLIQRTFYNSDPPPAIPQKPLLIYRCSRPDGTTQNVYKY